MSNQVQLKLDDKQIINFLQSIKPNKLKNALNSGARHSLAIIKKRAIEVLNWMHPWKNGNKVNTKKQYTFKKYVNGVKYQWKLPSFEKSIKIKTSKRDFFTSRVEIISKKGNPLLVMMEASKGERYTKGKTRLFRKSKRSHSTGSITRTFFSKAINDSRSAVHKSLEKSLHNSIMKAKMKAEQGK